MFQNYESQSTKHQYFKTNGLKCLLFIQHSTKFNQMKNLPCYHNSYSKQYYYNKNPEAMTI